MPRPKTKTTFNRIPADKETAGKKTRKKPDNVCPYWSGPGKIIIGGPDCHRTRQHSKAICKDCARWKK